MRRVIVFLLGVACTPVPTTPTATTVPANPFASAKLYIDDRWASKVEATAKGDLEHAEMIRKAASQPTGVWIDSIAHLNVVERTLSKADPSQVAVFVLYDLPNRDCSAKASAGELAVDQNGEARYRSEVVDPIAAQFRSHPHQRSVIVIEPDSLPNIATNLSNARCAASESAYRKSIAYAVKTLAMPNVSVYLDAAHSGWLGWDGNRDKIAKVYSEVLADAGGPDKIRGFAINVSGYGSVNGDVGKRDHNPCANETEYVEKLSASLAKVGITQKYFIIDTSRSGVADARTKGGNWCNVKNAGLGPRAQANPSPFVDAYFWIKPPGDSDGTSDTASPRFDQNCASEDAVPHAPEAGQWFAPYFVTLAQNANPPL